MPADITAPHSTIDYLGLHAARTPDRLAFLFNGQEITYSQFHHDALRMVSALRDLGISPRQLIGVELSNFYLHWLITLGIDVLGAASFSYARADIDLVKKTLSQMDLVFCSPDLVPPDVQRLHLIDDVWLKSLQTFSAKPQITTASHNPDDPFRIVMSSGTTGDRKSMLQSRSAFEERLRQAQAQAGFNENTRYLLAFGFPVQAYHLHASAVIRNGGACLFDRAAPISHSLTKLAVTDILLLPKSLISLTNSLPSDYVPLPGRRIFIIGGNLPKNLRTEIACKLHVEFFESYGSNETGAIARVSADGIATAIPGVEIQVVNDKGQPVIHQDGSIRVRSRGSVAGYLNDPATTALKFRDGWFYPGDLGVMLDQQRLRITGREDDILNIRGLKYNAREFEEKLISGWPIKDACLTMVKEDDGSAVLWAVIVADNPAEAPALLKKLSERITDAFGPSKLASMDEIPRTTTGKLQRNRLAEILRKQGDSMT